MLPVKSLFLYHEQYNGAVINDMPPNYRNGGIIRILNIGGRYEIDFRRQNANSLLSPPEHYVGSVAGSNPTSIEWSKNLTNADLTDVIADLKAEANKGLSARRIVQCDTNTLNTPFKAGLTNGASGTAFICMSSSSYGTILYIVSGSEKMFMLCKTSGTWGNWIAK